MATENVEVIPKFVKLELCKMWIMECVDSILVGQLVEGRSGPPLSPQLSYPYKIENPNSDEGHVHTKKITFIPKQCPYKKDRASQKNDLLLIKTWSRHDMSHCTIGVGLKKQNLLVTRLAYHANHVVYLSQSHDMGRPLFWSV